MKNIDMPMIMRIRGKTEEKFLKGYHYHI